MTVIVIVGVLAGLAIYGTRRYVFASRTAEAGEMINAIKTAQESYRSDAMTYLDVSGVHAVSDMSGFAPSTAPGNFKTAWGGGANAARWKQLNVRPDGSPLYFVYACSAGELPANKVDDYDVAGIWASHAVTNKTITGWPPAALTAGSWYVVKAVGNLNGDKTSQLWVTASFTDQVFNNDDAD